MAPPFGLNVDDYLNIDFGINDGTDPEDSSLIRPSDVAHYEYGKLPPYADKALELSSQQAIAEHNAMSDLMQAINKQAYVSPEQGIATALLAAIPTFGGYMIGKSVGSPDLPPGYFEAGGTRAAIGLDKMGDPATQGALAGLEAGQGAAGSYLKSLDADQAQKNEVYAKLAQIEANKASRLQTKADQYELAGMNQEAMAQRQANYLNQLQAYRDSKGQGSGRSPTHFDLMTDAQRQGVLAKESGVDVNGNPIEKPARLSDLPVAAQNDIAERKALIDLARNTANELSTAVGYKTWADYQLAKQASGLDPNAILLSIRDLADRVLRSRSGAAAPVKEQDRIASFVAGDLTASPAQVVSFIKKYAERERQFGQSQIQTFEALQNPETRGQIFKEYANEASGITSGGAPLGYDPQDAGFLEWKKRNGR